MSTLSTICQKHIKHIEAYCSDDCNLLCINCILYDGHKGHQFQSIEDSVRAEYNKFTQCSEQVQANHQKTIKIAQYLTQLNTEIESEHFKQTQDVQKFFTCLRSIVDERENKLLESINQCLATQKQQLQTTSAKVQQMAADLTQYLEEFNQIQLKSKDPISFLAQSPLRNQLLQKLPQNVVKPELAVKFPELNKENETNLIIKTLMSAKQQKVVAIKATPQQVQKKAGPPPQKESQKKNLQQSRKVPLAEMVPNSVQINLKKKVEENQNLNLGSLATQANMCKQQQSIRLTNFHEARNQLKERNYEKSQERRRDHSTPRRLFKNRSKQLQEQGNQSPFNNNHKSATDIEVQDDSMKQEFQTFLNSVQDFDPDYSHLNLSLDYSYITVGGFVDHIKQLVEKYDVKLEQSLEKDCLKSNRCKFGLAHLLNGNVLLIGGKQDGVRLDNCEEYNHREKKVLASKIKLPTVRSGFGTLNINQFIYIIGGNDGTDNLKDVDCFNQIDQQWSKMPQMLETRDELAVCFYENAIFAIGGFGGQFNTCLKTVEVYLQNKWQTCAPLNVPRRALSAVALPDGIYAIGGFDGSQYLNSVERYDDGRWVLIESMRHPRCTLSALPTPDNQYIYVFGGFNNGPLDSVERYSVLNGSWEESSKLLAKRFMHQTFICLN